MGVGVGMGELWAGVKEGRIGGVGEGGVREGRVWGRGRGWRGRGGR